MASAIDATKPVAGSPTTASVRANFAAAKAEIEALQAIVSSGAGSPTFNTVTVTSKFLAADGSAVAPAYSFSAAIGDGMYRSAGPAFAAGGGFVGRFVPTGLQIKASGFLGFSAADTDDSGFDVILNRDAANTLAQRNGVNEQSFRLYNTFTDAANYERLHIEWAANKAFLYTTAAGTGTHRALWIGTVGSQQLTLATANTDRWNIAATGHIQAVADNSYDIGASGASRPRNLYITSVYRTDSSSANNVGFVGSGASGNVQIGVEGANATFHSSSGYLSFRTGTSLEQFRVVHTASAVNYAEITGGATGTGPRLRAQGSDADVVLTLSSKGTAYVSIGTNAGATEQMRVAHTASAVNYVQVTGAAAGLRPTLSVAGSDTNVGINVLAKGSGRISFFGYNGSARILEVVPNSSADVNYFEMWGTATGSSPQLRVNGTDTNVGFELFTKGAGGLAFFSHTDTASARQFQIIGTASAVNYLQVTGASTTNSPTLSAVGSDATVNLILNAKSATGIVILQAGAATAFQAAGVASAVNYVQVLGAATGGSVRIVAAGTDTNIGLRVEGKGGSGVELLGNGGVQFTSGNVISAVNNIRVDGAAATASPALYVQGSDTNIGLVIGSKGTGAISLSTNGTATPQFQVIHTASAVNFFVVRGAATTARPSFIVEGTDANIGTAFSSKGTGTLGFYTNNLGVVGFEVQHVASGVNYLQVSPAATGGAPILQVIGETNVGMTLTTKGTGVLNLNVTSTGDIRWNKPNVALGGGATPTFGTIGGSGPAAAAQRNWLRFLESDGTASFIPVWR